ncbi:MAG: hypothetical protein ACRD8O_01530 [Bryobacteraceae bacterium]
MGLITVSGQAGCRFEEVARLVAQRLGFQLVTESQLSHAIAQEFGSDIPARAYADVVASVVARRATEQHMVVAADGVEFIFTRFPDLFRLHVVAPIAARAGYVMIDRRVDRTAARQVLRELEQDKRRLRRNRFGRATAPDPSFFDAVLNAEKLAPEHMSAIVESAARSCGLTERGLLPPESEAQFQFQVRLRLARHGVAPPDRVTLDHKPFAHPSEETFANLLDFYRIAWEYEPRSFPIQWDRDGKPIESFTPDFYLPEADLYVELTTMKQSLVTKKNRKVKLLRQLYPQINIQVYYQKDLEDLIFKHGLAERLVPA